MKTLTQLHVVQFSFWDYETFNLRLGGTAFLGPNGAGKTSIVDAVQIAILGGNTHHFNTQLVHRDHRTIRDYALGAMRSDDGNKGVLTRKREDAISYITLVFEGETPEHVVSLGICIHATSREKKHSVLGLYVVPGVRLALEDHLGALGSGEKAPLDWRMFDAQLRRMAKEAECSPTITDAPKKFLGELLHCLQHRGRSIQPDKFARAFAQSLQLKGIQSVNDYLRGYLVDSEQIDKSGTLGHIKNVRKLGLQIVQVKEQIVELGALEKRFHSLNTLYETRQTADAVHLQLAVEGLDAHIAHLLEKEERLDGNLTEAARACQAKADEALLLRQSWENLVVSYNADPLSKRPEEVRTLRLARASSMAERRKVVERLALLVRDALIKTADAPDGEWALVASNGKALLSRWDRCHEQGQLPTPQMCEEALGYLASASSQVAERLAQDQESSTVASQALRAMAQRSEAASKGIRLREEDDRIALVMAMFQDAGINSATVASLVRVNDEQWQPAIESFLGGNRFALVVDPNRERDAVRIMRTTGKHAYNVTVVQPEHLRDVIDRTPEAVSVASLIGGDHPVALAYLRRCIGPLRQVDTEEELEKYDRSLSSDGMLSLNGGTRRIRLIDKGLWELGARPAGSDVQFLREETTRLIQVEVATKQRLQESRRADEALQRARNEAANAIFGSALIALAAAAAELDATDDVPDADLPQHLKDLVASMNNMKRQAEDAEQRHAQLSNKVGGITTELSNTRVGFATSREELVTNQRRLADARGHQDFSEELGVTIYSAAAQVAATEGLPVAAEMLTQKAEASNRSITKSQTQLGADFLEFINARTINLVEERSDWRKAWQWTRLHSAKLMNSTLAEYESHTEEARIAANKAFRSDVAFKIREAIKRVVHDIAELNKILTSCPEFTGGEKYKFRAEPSAAYKDLYHLIEGSALLDGSATPLESASDSTQAQLLGLLNACESGNSKEPNPLEDYRLLFNFDLDIYVDGVRVDSLSKRLGVGSNGEHLVPFYVIAGASLANAYGMKAGCEHDGAAIMLIDEAFHGFDAQNTYVTGLFLRSLGLQLVMAAPDADVGKIAPVIDSFYDLNRFGPDVFAFEKLAKQPVKHLFMRDIPGQNPALVADRVAQLSLIDE